MHVFLKYTSNKIVMSIESLGLKCIPFLRWAGGKNWLVKHIDEIVSLHKFNNYFEPFLGGASMMLYLKPSKTAYLSDTNSNLIETYIQIRDNVEGVIKELSKFKNTESDYYTARSSKFNLPQKRAACFIFLNQTSFNGIYRENLRGEYNVPYGFRKSKIYDTQNLRQVSHILRNAHIDVGDFEINRDKIKKNDLVFLDPPYTIAHNENGFIKYNQKLFSLEDQYRLSQLVDFIKSKNAFYILTNAAHKVVEDIFEKGDSKIVFERPSLVGGAKAQRGIYKEFVFTNIK